jgi:pimeloyl-ACP methyl ester carboxylesterase
VTRRALLMARGTRSPAEYRRVTTEKVAAVRTSVRALMRGRGRAANVMPAITTKDGVEIFYKDWGTGQAIVFSHGWPLSADDWDTQMLFFMNHGYRVIAHDRRGHGRSSQVGDGHDMDHYADDLAALTAHLDLKNAVHVGHSTGGGEVVHYIARHQTDFTGDLKKITVPVFVMHGDDDQIVPYPDSAPLSANLLKNGTLKTYKGFPHGMPTTEADTINADLLEFIRG